MQVFKGKTSSWPNTVLSGIFGPVKGKLRTFVIKIEVFSLS